MGASLVEGVKTLSERSPKSRILPVALLLVAAVLFLLLRSASGPSGGEEPSVATPASDAALSDETSAAAGASGRRAEKPLGKDPAAADAETVAYLQDKFGATITDKRTQVKAVEKLIEYLMRNYPDDWQQRLQAMLARAFPGLADQLYATYQNMTAYNDWLKSHRQELSQMDADAMRAAMRDARTRFFGSDAEQIWAEAIRHEQILDTVDAIRESPATATTVGEKLEAFVGAIEETYGDDAPSFLERRQAELMNNFLAIDTVQDGLHGMSPAERAQELAGIRRGLGMDDAALERWRELDAQRDRAWETGERYMRQRDEIVQKFQGDEQARRLAALRGSSFGEEADIVREEEESGFFRFGHRRVFGNE